MICAQKRNERSLPISYHQKKEKESLLTSHVFPTQTKTRHQSHAVNDGANCLCTLKKRQDFGSGF